MNTGDCCRSRILALKKPLIPDIPPSPSGQSVSFSCFILFLTCFFSSDSVLSFLIDPVEEQSPYWCPLCSPSLPVDFIFAVRGLNLRVGNFSLVIFPDRRKPAKNTFALVLFSLSLSHSLSVSSSLLFLFSLIFHFFSFLFFPFLFFFFPSLSLFLSPPRAGQTRPWTGLDTSPFPGCLGQQWFLSLCLPIPTSNHH
ncbi:uncharacterized protein BO97DRAFT_87536 [Aspergillus homomorphus CBS 101889]|uniref:Uncharacterized protein n=1 Tax=Aspergillus homomorphus (strain CBS 101889) TaxID=1450537 RepID=A0A395HVN0_ASPHC|nr:hypothetical protein BO97DRAFT_87536 [Aspergillus homomorphus CBS 101889]RAL11860.1 hypothetical protein BO97DRAFT_87536 [Aspergillus homomorphus CBS 101889]